jgi:hypothetical protein
VLLGDGPHAHLPARAALVPAHAAEPAPGGCRAAEAGAQGCWGGAQGQGQHNAAIGSPLACWQPPQPSRPTRGKVLPAGRAPARALAAGVGAVASALRDVSLATCAGQRQAPSASGKGRHARAGPAAARRGARAPQGSRPAALAASPLQPLQRPAPPHPGPLATHSLRS